MGNRVIYVGKNRANILLYSGKVRFGATPALHLGNGDCFQGYGEAGAGTRVFFCEGASFADPRRTGTEEAIYSQDMT